MTVDVAFYLTLLPALALIGWGLWLWAVRAGRSRRAAMPGLDSLAAFLASGEPYTIQIQAGSVLPADHPRVQARRRWPWDATADLNTIDWSMEP